jgi:hypothetical protein
MFDCFEHNLFAGKAVLKNPDHFDPGLHIFGNEALSINNGNVLL